jgi:hypothetical protein
MTHIGECVALALPAPQDDSSSVHITIQDSAADAAMNALAERLFHDPPASRTFLGRPTLVDEDELPTSLFRFVGQDSLELTPTLIIHVLCQKGLGKTSNVQVLQVDDVEFADKSTRQLVMVITPHPCFLEPCLA